MAAWLVVLDHPFFSVTKKDGTFAIKGLPDGDYTLQFWHEKFGAKEAKVSVKGGNGTVDFAFAATAQATPSTSEVIAALNAGRMPSTDSTPLMMSTSGAKAESDSCCCAPSAAAAIMAAK
jgi:hypothetical protein